MLAKAAPPSSDFHALARYLVYGKSGNPSPTRVAWILAHNLATADPETAAKIMTATAALSPRTKNAAYHLMLSWSPEERPNPEVMQLIAKQTLDLAELSEHQALIMGHGDTDAPHLHMMINRVHPLTGRAWKTSHDYARLDKIMKQLAEQHGFLYVPTHTYSPETTADCRKGPNTRAKRAARRGADTDRPQLSRIEAQALGEDLSENLDHATTWEDIEDSLAAHGFTVEAKGKGHVARHAGGAYVKMSALRLTPTAKTSFERLRSTAPRPEHKTQHRVEPTGPTHNTAGVPSLAHRPTRPVLAADGVDIVRFLTTYGLTDRDDLRDAVADATSARQARLARKPLRHQLSADLAGTLKASTALTPPRRHEHVSARSRGVMRASGRNPSRSR